jgi:hypothetical protein
MRHTGIRRRARFSGVAAGIIGATALISSSPAMADQVLTANMTGASALECQAPVLSQPFLSLRDNRQYTLAPGSDFSNPAGAGWQFFGGAHIAQAAGPDGRSGTLDLPSGSTAVSPVMCVDMTYPTARIWAKSIVADGDVTVSVSYAATKTALKPQTVGSVKGGRNAWALSSDVAIRPQLAGKADGWRKVAFILTARSNHGDFQVDNFFVDPRMRG